MTTPCSHGMPTPAACYECMEDGNLDPPPPPPTPTLVRQITARYDGQCPGCNLGIHVGQTIAQMSDGTHLHAGCTP